MSIAAVTPQTYPARPQLTNCGGARPAGFGRVLREVLAGTA
jgi:hypothetical protein